MTGKTVTESLPPLLIIMAAYTRTHTHLVLVLALPDNINGSRPDFGVAAHNGHAGSKRAVDAEHHTLHTPRQHSQVGLSAGLVAPLGRKRRNVTPST